MFTAEDLDAYMDGAKRTREGQTQEMWIDPAPRVTCVDGFDMSVQARWSCYCEPQNNFGPWDTFEVGYPNEAEELLMPYDASGKDDPTDNIYSYVPKSVIVDVINKHGGLLAEGQSITPKYTSLDAAATGVVKDGVVIHTPEETV